MGRNKGFKVVEKAGRVDLDMCFAISLICMGEACLAQGDPLGHPYLIELVIY